MEKETRIPTDNIRLRRSELLPDPIQQFTRWLEEAQERGVEYPIAMTLATATQDGYPNARMVLLKEYDQRGFCFFTNYGSQKSREIFGNPRAALVFYWQALNRQVRIRGTVEKTSPEESDAYYKTRPIGSQIRAWASLHSEIVQSGHTLEEKFREFEMRFPEGVIPRPDHWGGFRLIPEEIEFWQSRINRLHDRFLYTRAGKNEWRIERLFP